MSGNKKANNTECDEYFDSLDTKFFEPVTTSVFKPGDTASIQWYAGVVPEVGHPSSLNMTFNLVLSAYRNDSYVYNVLKNTTVPFSGRANKDPVYWSYIPSPPCPSATEISYFWPIPGDFEPASETDFDYVLLLETIIETGWALSQSDPFRIVAPLPSTSTSTSISATSPTTSSASTSSNSNTASMMPDNSPSHIPSTDSTSRNHLSPGAKAGIAVGTIIGGLALILAAWAFYKRRRKAQQGEVVPSEETSAPPIPTNIHNTYMDNVYSTPGTTNEKVEIDGRQIPRESGGTALHELEAATSQREQRDTVVSELSGETFH
ncbi:hypothetical protein F4801DRAFT_538216 [Xylaria longipes]|nr:hypothetical protein F4801DRAFT_538216 [Xylaria longipes]RYC55108.1 hypothetical protein CHU98_g11105 [Xylaria longipes]